MRERRERHECHRREQKQANATRRQRCHREPSPEEVGISFRRGVALLRGRLRVGRPGYQHDVLRAHVLVRLFPCRRLLLREPRRLHVAFDLLEGRNAARDERVDEHEMPAESRFDGALPRSCRQLHHGKREHRAELLAEVFRRAIAVILLEHERIAERRRELGVLRLTRELGKGVDGIVLRARAALVGCEVKVAEGNARRRLELVGILLEPGLELGRCRLARGRDVLGDELHLLRHAALHDGVVLVEAHREALAIQDFLLHLGLDHAAEFRRGRVALPLRLEQHRELCKVAVRQLDLP